MIEYFLKFWGRDKELIKEKLNLKSSNLWFNTKEERDNLIGKIHKTGYVVTDTKDGEMTHKRTIAKMDLIYKDKKYPIEYDFGYEFEEKDARFMFFDGGHSCDCNKSLFIQRYCDENFPELGCGDEIDIENFRIEYID